MVLWQWVGFGAVSLLGTLLHFLYGWTGSSFAALFAAVNESTWEHMKLLFFPALVFAAVRWGFGGGETGGFWCVKLCGILLGITLIPVQFYTLRGVFGATPGWVNIAIFFVAVGGMFLLEQQLFRAGTFSAVPCAWAPIVLCGIAVLFWVFTCNPPKIPLFRDPISGGYGMG